MTMSGVEEKTAEKEDEDEDEAGGHIVPSCECRHIAVFDPTDSSGDRSDVPKYLPT